MKARAIVCSCLAVAAGSGASSAQAAALYGALVGTFDPAGGAGASLNQGVTSNEPGITVATWQSRVSLAFSAGLGGVWNSSTTAPGTVYNDASAVGSFGSADGGPLSLIVVNGKTLNLAALNATNLHVGEYSSATAISGVGIISTADQTDAAWGMSFAPAGFDPGALIKELGFANVGRSGSVGTAVSFIVTYTDNTTETTGNLTPLAQGNARLVHFVAPAGQGIKQLDLAINGTRGIQLDDLSFVVAVPEPATLGLLALAGVLLGRRRPA